MKAFLRSHMHCSACAHAAAIRDWQAAVVWNGTSLHATQTYLFPKMTNATVRLAPPRVDAVDLPMHYLKTSSYAVSLARVEGLPSSLRAGFFTAPDLLAQESSLMFNVGEKKTTLVPHSYATIPKGFAGSVPQGHLAQGEGGHGLWVATGGSWRLSAAC